MFKRAADDSSVVIDGFSFPGWTIVLLMIMIAAVAVGLGVCSCKRKLADRQQRKTEDLRDRIVHVVV